jgi:hypothetical protein
MIVSQDYGTPLAWTSGVCGVSVCGLRKSTARRIIDR